MSDATSVLFGLEHEFSVLERRRVDTTAVKVIIEQAAREGPCPECGVFSGTVKDRPVVRLKDLPTFGQTVQLWWRKRRVICDETIQTWWPAILTALINDVDNARTEGFNRIIKQVKRTGCGYRNMINYQRRILTHIAVTRPQRSAA